MGALRNPTIPNLQIILKKKSSRFMRIFQKNLTWSLGLETVALKKPTKTACHDQPRIDRGQCCEAGGCKDPWPLGASLDFGWPPPLFFWRGGGGSTKMPGMKWGGEFKKPNGDFPYDLDLFTVNHHFLHHHLGCVFLLLEFPSICYMQIQDGSCIKRLGGFSWMTLELGDIDNEPKRTMVKHH